MFPSSSPSMNPIPGCSGRNDGGNYCIAPLSPETDSEIPALDSSASWSAHLGKVLLELCQGDCDIDSHCAEGLVCFERNDLSPIPGCTGIGTEGMDYCAFPELIKKSTIDSISNNGAFLRVADEGIVKVYDEFGTTLIWSSENDEVNKVVDQEFFDEYTDISIALEKLMYFAGPYAHLTIDIEFSNAEDAGLHIKDNLVEVHSSTSLAYKLLAPYPVTALSTISFTVTLGSEIKALAICIDDGVTKRVQGDGRAASSCLALGGSAIVETFGKDILHLGVLGEGVGELEDAILEGENVVQVRDLEQDPALAMYPLQTGTVEVKRKLKDLFPSKTSTVQYIAFVQIIDEVVASSPSIITNINLFEEQITLNTRRLSTSSTCQKGQLAAADKAGLHNTKNDLLNDFCVPSDKILQQITKNENDFCTIDNDCRSGLCVMDQCKSRVSMK